MNKEDKLAAGCLIVVAIIGAIAVCGAAQLAVWIIDLLT